MLAGAGEPEYVGVISPVTVLQRCSVFVGHVFRSQSRHVLTGVSGITHWHEEMQGLTPVKATLAREMGERTPSIGMLTV